MELLLSAGWLAISTVGHPGAQGADVTGVQGMGVSTPKAAAVAEATAGLAIDVHIPKGSILAKGLLSIMVAAGIVAFTLLVGRIINVPGAAPKLHCRVAPLQTSNPMCSDLQSSHHQSPVPSFRRATFTVLFTQVKIDPGNLILAIYFNNLYKLAAGIVEITVLEEHYTFLK